VKPSSSCPLCVCPLDPPQVDALAALLDARKLVDEALKKVQDQLKDQERESIRQA